MRNRHKFHLQEYYVKCTFEEKDETPARGELTDYWVCHAVLQHEAGFPLDLENLEK